MSDGEPGFETLGAEATPAGLAFINRTVQEVMLETPLQRQQPRKQLELLGLIAIVTRWLKKDTAF